MNSGAAYIHCTRRLHRRIRELGGGAGVVQPGSCKLGSQRKGVFLGSHSIPGGTDTTFRSVYEDHIGDVS